MRPDMPNPSEHSPGSAKKQAEAQAQPPWPSKAAAICRVDGLHSIGLWWVSQPYHVFDESHGNRYSSRRLWQSKNRVNVHSHNHSHSHSRVRTATVSTGGPRPSSGLSRHGDSALGKMTASSIRWIDSLFVSQSVSQSVGQSLPPSLPPSLTHS